MTINRMVEFLAFEHACMLRNSHGDCDRHCEDCNLVQDDGELHEMYTSVIALLKAQEPRVMTLEYFDNSPDKDSKGCLVAWVEYRRDEEWAEYWEDTCDEWSVIRRDDFCSGESYRFWTSRPDEKRRAETPWN